MNNTYWNHNGELQSEYNEMLKAEHEGRFTFTKKSLGVFHTYYRYFNDGDLPGWARGDWRLTTYGRWGRELNDAGEEELERRATERIAAEWKRYSK